MAEVTHSGNVVFISTNIFFLRCVKTNHNIGLFSFAVTSEKLLIGLMVLFCIVMVIYLMHLQCIKILFAFKTYFTMLSV